MYSQSPPLVAGTNRKSRAQAHRHSTVGGGGRSARLLDYDNGTSKTTTSHTRLARYSVPQIPDAEVIESHPRRKRASLLPPLDAWQVGDFGRSNGPPSNSETKSWLPLQSVNGGAPASYGSESSHASRERWDNFDRRHKVDRPRKLTGFRYTPPKSNATRSTYETTATIGAPRIQQQHRCCDWSKPTLSKKASLNSPLSSASAKSSKAPPIHSHSDTFGRRQNSQFRISPPSNRKSLAPTDRLLWSTSYRPRGDSAATVNRPRTSCATCESSSSVTGSPRAGTAEDNWPTSSAMQEQLEVTDNSDDLDAMVAFGAESNNTLAEALEDHITENYSSAEISDDFSPGICDTPRSEDPDELDGMFAVLKLNSVKGSGYHSRDTSRRKTVYMPASRYLEENRSYSRRRSGGAEWRRETYTGGGEWKRDGFPSHHYLPPPIQPRPVDLSDVCPQFTMEEIRQATKNFANSNKLGEGANGQVYLGVLNSGTEVAVKVMTTRGGTGGGFEEEIRVLSMFRHPNLVTLLGYVPGTERILIYEYLAKGDLCKLLHRDDYVNVNEPQSGRRGTGASLCSRLSAASSQRSGPRDGPLRWRMRVSAALDAAQGLAHLHSRNPKVFHRDIKSANILLDANGVAKLSDFGLAAYAPRSSPGKLTVRKAEGTPGYADPKYMNTLEVTEQTEMYSFGIVLLELLTSRSPAVFYTVEGKDDELRYFLDDININDPQSVLPFVDRQCGWPTDFDLQWAILAFSCIQPTASRRPKCAEVVRVLRNLKEAASQYSSECQPSPSCPSHQPQQPPSYNPSTGRFNYGTTGANMDKTRPSLVSSSRRQCTFSQRSCDLSAAERRHL